MAPTERSVEKRLDMLEELKVLCSAHPDRAMARSLLKTASGALWDHDEQLLEFMIEALVQKSSIPLVEACDFYLTLKSAGYTNRLPLLTHQNVTMYARLNAAILILLDVSDGDCYDVHCAAVLSGETDANLLESLITERSPKNAEEFTQMLTAVKDVPRGFSSGAL